MAFLLNPKLYRPINPAQGWDFRKLAEASGQTFKKGQFVYFATAGGGLTVWATEGSDKILGIANEDASGTAGTLIEVVVLHPGDQIIIKYTGTAPKDLMAYGLAISANVSYLDTAEVTATFFVTQAEPDTTATTVQVSLIATKLQAEVGV